MIRKNRVLLELIENLYQTSDGKEDILLRNFEAGHQLIHQEVQGQKIYCIKSGVVKVFTTEENDKFYIHEFLGEGEVLGEIEAIRKVPAICTVEAITPMTVYMMNTSHFFHLLQTIPHFNSVIMGQLATRVANSSIKNAQQQLYPQSALLPQLLETLNAQQILFTKQDLAEYMGISVRSLNRLLQDKEIGL